MADHSKVAKQWDEGTKAASFSPLECTPLVFAEGGIPRMGQNGGGVGSKGFKPSFWGIGVARNKPTNC